MRRSAKITMTNEVANDSGLRCRSRSCSRASSEEEFYSPSTSGDHQAPPKVSGSPSSNFGSTPGYGLKFHPRESRYRRDLDSGFLEDSNISGGSMNVSGEFKPSSLITKLAEKTSDILSDDVKGNLSDLKKRWKKYNSALYSSGPVRAHSMKLNDLLPIVVMIITLGSAIFTVCMLTNALNRAERIRNGKYESIEYAHEKKIGKLRVPTPIIDENGVVLGGKKASIQFAYNMRQQLEQDQAPSKDHEKKDGESSVLTDEEIINRLTFKVANDVMKIYDGVQKQENLDKSAKKERLLKKMGEFGHFGTSAVQPLDLEEKLAVAAKEPISKNSIGEVQKEPVSKNVIKEIAIPIQGAPERLIKEEPVPDTKVQKPLEDGEASENKVEKLLEAPEKKEKVEKPLEDNKVPSKKVDKPLEDGMKTALREKREVGDMSFKPNPFRINGEPEISPIITGEDDPFRFL